MEMRLQRAIAEAGVCSRRKAEELIEGGHVRVNGQVAVIGANVDPAKDEIMIRGVLLRPERKVYLMLNKPRGYITTAVDPYDRKNVMDLVHEGRRVFPVGRLDRDTSGMLLLTNDGEFANRITHPRYEVSKTYEATLDDRIDDDSIARINEGLHIDGMPVRAFARKMAPKIVRVTVHTGMNKEVKRLFKQVGRWVIALKRVEINGVRLDQKEGKYRHLVPSEIKKLLGEGVPVPKPKSLKVVVPPPKAGSLPARSVRATEPMRDVAVQVSSRGRVRPAPGEFSRRAPRSAASRSVPPRAVAPVGRPPVDTRRPVRREMFKPQDRELTAYVERNKRAGDDRAERPRRDDMPRQDGSPRRDTSRRSAAPYARPRGRDDTPRPFAPRSHRAPQHGAGAPPSYATRKPRSDRPDERRRDERPRAGDERPKPRPFVKRPSTAPPHGVVRKRKPQRRT
jgi:23S rRNA pseudouridine2605 synthase